MRPSMQQLAALAFAVLALSTTACRCKHPALGCRGKAPSDQVVRSLSHHTAAVRRDAARVLRTERGVPDSAVDPLIQALMRERDKDAHGEMLVTLGYSGHEDALQHILITLKIRDTEAQRYGTDALWAWRVANGLERDTEPPASFRPYEP